MGTYTFYKLKSTCNITSYPADCSDLDAMKYLIEDRQVDAKWYKHREDLVKLSLINPDQLLVVECASEDEEYWKIWVLNGIIKEVKGKVVYPDIDLSELYKEAGW